MIAGATRGKGGIALARHLLKESDDQTVEVLPPRGLAAETLSEQIRELVAIAAHGRTARPIHHVHIDPPLDAHNPAEIIDKFIEHYEREFGLQDVQRCGVFHTKSGRTHAHIVWSLVRDDGSVVSLAHDHPRREKVSRITEFECGLPFVRGKHNRSAAAALRNEGRADVAEAMLEAGLLNGKRPIAHSTPRQRAQAERTSVPLDEIRIQALAAWQASNDARTFAVALHSFDFSVASGKLGFVLVDRTGAVHSLTRTLAAAAREEGIEKVTAAAVRRRLAGINFPTIKEIKDGRNAQSSSRKSRRSNFQRSEVRPRDIARVTPTLVSAPREPGRRDKSIGRDQWSAHGDRPNSQSPEHNPRTPRRRTIERVAVIRIGGDDSFRKLRSSAEAIMSGERRPKSLRRLAFERAAVVSLSGTDFTAAKACAAKLAAGSSLDHTLLGALTEARMKSLKPAKKLDYRTQLLADIAPRGFDAAEFSNDLHMVKKPTPNNPRSRILTRDGGWIEIDTVSGKPIRTWGQVGRAQVLAQTLADSLGVEVEHLTRTMSLGANAHALKVIKSSEHSITSLAVWWSMRGFAAVDGPDGCWIDAGRSRIRDTGDQLEIHGGLTEAAIEATLVKARGAWDSCMYLHGRWTQAEQDQLWIAAQRQGIDVANCSPSQSVQNAWRAEQDLEAKNDKTILAVRTEIVDARDLIEAANGDLSAAARLPRSLQAFVALHLDDKQRKELAVQSIAELIPELKRFRAIGTVELDAYETSGRKFALPKAEDGKQGPEYAHSPR